MGIIPAKKEIFWAPTRRTHTRPLFAWPGANPGARAQVAGGVPANWEGFTQGRTRMKLSLFSRDTIAMPTAISLSHEMFDACLCLGVCDKIVPGLLIGA